MDDGGATGASAANAETAAMDAKADDARIAALCATLFLIYLFPASQPNGSPHPNHSTNLIPHISDGRSMSAVVVGTLG